MTRIGLRFDLYDFLTQEWERHKMTEDRTKFVGQSDEPKTVVITDAMRLAGIKAMYGGDLSLYDPSTVVARVYVAMRRLDPTPG